MDPSFPIIITIFRSKSLLKLKLQIALYKTQSKTCVATEP